MAKSSACYKSINSQWSKIKNTDWPWDKHYTSREGAQLGIPSRSELARHTWSSDTSEQHSPFWNSRWQNWKQIQPQPWQWFLTHQEALQSPPAPAPDHGLTSRVTPCPGPCPHQYHVLPTRPTATQLWGSPSTEIPQVKESWSCQTFDFHLKQI